MLNILSSFGQNDPAKPSLLKPDKASMGVNSSNRNQAKQDSEYAFNTQNGKDQKKPDEGFRGDEKQNRNQV
jgi:hypothetical protein